MTSLMDRVHICIPFRMLRQTYLDRFVELRMNPEIGFSADTLQRFPESAFKEVAGELRRAGLPITFHAPFEDLSPGSPDPDIRDLTRKRFDQVHRLASIFKPRSVVCHAGYDARRYGYLREEWLDRSIETWSRLAKQLAEEGAMLVLENVYEDGPEDIRCLFAALSGHEVGFCLDCGHTHAFSKTALAHWIDELGPFLRHVHLHDNSGADDEHLAMGRGGIDFTPLFDFILKDPGRSILMTIEAHREEDIWPSLDYLKRVFGSL